MDVVVHVLEQEVYESSLYFPLNFAMNLKLLLKRSLLIKKFICTEIFFFPHFAFQFERFLLTYLKAA